MSFLLIGSSVLSLAQNNDQKLQHALVSGITSNSFAIEEISTQKKKSAGVAVMYSLLVPGMGELYADGFDQGKYSLISEAALWVTYIGFQQYGAWLRDDARSFAVSRAGAQVNGKDAQYYVDLGNFIDTYEHNEKKLRDRELDKVYDINSDLFWKWDSDVSRQQYRQLRISSDKVFNNGKFVIGTILLNHIISAVNAARLVRMYNTSMDSKLESWWLESSLQESGALPDGIKLSLVHKF
jgi:hypothetical protein